MRPDIEGSTSVSPQTRTEDGAGGGFRAEGAEDGVRLGSPVLGRRATTRSGVTLRSGSPQAKNWAQNKKGTPP